MSDTTRISPWRRVATALSFVLVAGVAAVVSYSHIRDVALYGHQGNLIAHLIPLSIDGMMLIATLAMAEDKAANRNPRGWARSGFWFGAAVSVACNVASVVVEYGWQWLAIGISGLAPVLLLWAIEIMARPGKPREEAPVKTQQVITVAELAQPDYPDAPVSPAPRIGRPPIDTEIRPSGEVVNVDTGTPVSKSTAQRRRKVNA
jgi:hypothetical protein